jgi:hypothetical protein
LLPAHIEMLEFCLFSSRDCSQRLKCFGGSGDLGSGDIWFRFSCLELKINKEAFFRCVIRVCKNTFVSFGVNFGCSTFTGTFIAKLFQHKMLVEMQGIFFLFWALSFAFCDRMGECCWDPTVLLTGYSVEEKILCLSVPSIWLVKGILFCTVAILVPSNNCLLEVNEALWYFRCPYLMWQLSNLCQETKALYLSNADSLEYSSPFTNDKCAYARLLV